MLEKDLLKSVKARLSFWQLQGVVLHFDRINSGKMQINGRWVQLASAGTSDIIAYFKVDNLAWIYFIETKIEGNKQSASQVEFENKFKGISNIIYSVITHPNQIDEQIEKITNHSNNKLNSIEAP